MATRKAVDTKTMLAAADSGQQGIRDAAQRREQSSQHSREMALREGESVARTVHAGREQDEVERSNQAREGLQQQELNEQSRRNQMGEAIEQDRQDIEMADRGLESQGTSRADRLRQEMQRGSQQTAQDQAANERFRKATENDIEIAGPDSRSIAKTEERRAQEGSELTSKRLNAQAAYMNAARNLRDAKLKGNTDVVAKELKSLEQPIRSAARMFDSGKKDELTDSQWNDIQALAENNPDQGLQQEIASKTFGPALGRFLQSRVAESSLRYMAVDGDMPDGDLVDMASPMMQTFTTAANQMQQFLKMADMGGLISMGLDIQDLASRNRMVRKLTAQALLQTMANPQAGSNTVIPSQGGAGARQQHQQQGQLPGSSVGGKVGLTDRPAAGDPNQRTGSPVQGALAGREQQTIDEQQRADEDRRSRSAWQGQGATSQRSR